MKPLRRRLLVNSRSVLVQIIEDLIPTFSSKEECGIEASLDHCGTLLFAIQGGPEWAFQIELYRADAYTGALIEFVFSFPFLSPPPCFPSHAYHLGQKRCDPSGFLLPTRNPSKFHRQQMPFYLPYPTIPCGPMTFTGCLSSFLINLLLGVPTLILIPLAHTECLDGGLASLQHNLVFAINKLSINSRILL